MATRQLYYSVKSVKIITYDGTRYNLKLIKVSNRYKIYDSESDNIIAHENKNVVISGMNIIEFIDDKGKRHRFSIRDLVFFRIHNRDHDRFFLCFNVVNERR